MSRCHLNLEDMPDGTIALQVCYVGGFDVKSHAHQHALLLIRKMDEMADRRGEPVIEVSQSEDALLAVARPADVLCPPSRQLHPGSDRSRIAFPALEPLPSLAQIDERPAEPSDGGA
jgi:hypothetical protein